MVVVEHQVGIGRVGQVGGDVAGTDLHLPVLDVLGMHEQDLPDQPELLEQHRADQSVEVAPRDQPVSLGSQGAPFSSTRALAPCP